MTNSLKLFFFGPPQLILPAGETRPLGGDSALLLAYLALAPHKAFPRDELTALFYPDHADKQAGQNFRQILTRLRRALGDEQAESPYLHATSHTLQFNADSHAWLDVAEFTRLIDLTRRHRHRRLTACRHCMARLAQAVPLYRGDFLHGLGYLDDELPLGDLLEATRATLRQQVTAALHALAEHSLQRQEFEAAEGYTATLLQLDPLDEAAGRFQMQTLALQGQRSQALRRYYDLKHKLQTHLDAEPDSQTIMLAQSIRAGRALNVTPRRFQRSDKLLTFQQFSATALPNMLVPFVGRTAELARISGHLADQDCRLITLVGPGGSGKSRLAMRAAADDAPGWADGAWLALLDDHPGAIDLESGLINALGLTVPKNGSPRQAIAAFLRDKELLLMLDNFEQMTIHSPLLKWLLDNTRHLKLIVTSRQPLGLRGEQIIPVRGLDYPDSGQPEPSPANLPDWAQSFSAIRFFIENARRVDPAFQLDPANLPAVIRICRQVDGLPLALELAAGWVRAFSCAEIAERIADSLDFLHRRVNDTPPRHSSLRTVFDQSWYALSPDEQLILTQLSVFQRAFSLEAAETVAGATPAQLAALVDKSLVQPMPGHHFRLNPLLSQYAAEKLALDAALYPSIHHRHSAWFLTRPAEADSPDIQAARQWATQNRLAAPNP
jgi:predicted ATPase/DNA-binding SARP family transcriptional activator